MTFPDPQPGTTWTWDQPGITGPLVGCDGLGERQRGRGLPEIAEVLGTLMYFG